MGKRKEMDTLESRRRTWREKKQRQRAKIREDNNKLQEMREKDRQRKMLQRKLHRENATPSDLDRIREKKRKEMQRYRAKKRQSRQESGLLESTKRHKAAKKGHQSRKNKENMRIQRERERAKTLFRQREVARVQNYRMRIKLKNYNQCGEESEEDKSGFRSPKAAWRATKKVKDVLPNTPRKKVEILERISKSPRCAKIMRRQGLFLTEVQQSKIEIGEALGKSMADALADTKSHGTGIKHKLHAHKILVRASLQSLKSTNKRRARSLLRAKLCLGKKATHVKNMRRQWWMPRPRKTRKDRVSEEIRERVVNYYQDPQVSRAVPDKGAALQVNGSTVPRFYLTCTVKEAYESYCKEYPVHKIGFSTFKKLRPKNVRRISETNRKTCLCQTCANPSLKAEALKQYCGKSPIGEVQSCCKEIITSKREMSRATLCPYDDQPKPTCLNRNCQECGAKNLKMKYKTVIERSDANTEITWYEWGPMLISKNGTTKRIVSCQPRTAPLKDFFTAYERELETLPQHLFRADWQQRALANCVEAVCSDTEALMVMDYAESYQCIYKDEVQSAFFEQNTVTIHPIMAYYKVSDILHKHAIICISPDDTKDASGVLEFEKAAVRIIERKIPQLKKIYEFTDGCAGQYKARKAFYDISVNNTMVCRNYFETSHGKNVCDGLGSTVKHSAYNAVLSGKYVIPNAETFYTFCNDKLATDFKVNARNGETVVSKREFVFCTNDPAYDRPDVKTLKGTRLLHAVENTGTPLLLRTRSLSCFCSGCKNNSECTNMEYVDNWEMRWLNLQNPECSIL